MTDRDRLIEKFDYLQNVYMEDDDYDYYNEFLVDRLLADKDIILPDNEAIMFVKDNWLMLNIENELLGEAIKQCVKYLTKGA